MGSWKSVLIFRLGPYGHFSFSFSLSERTCLSAAPERQVISLLSLLSEVERTKERRDFSLFDTIEVYYINTRLLLLLAMLRGVDSETGDDRTFISSSIHLPKARLRSGGEKKNGLGCSLNKRRKNEALRATKTAFCSPALSIVQYWRKKPSLFLLGAKERKLLFSNLPRERQTTIKWLPSNGYLSTLFCKQTVIARPRNNKQIASLTWVTLALHKREFSPNWTRTTLSIKQHGSHLLNRSLGPITTAAACFRSDLIKKRESLARARLNSPCHRLDEEQLVVVVSIYSNVVLRICWSSRG